MEGKAFLDFENANDADLAKGALIGRREEGYVRSAWFSNGPITRVPRTAAEPTAHLYVGNLDGSVELTDILKMCDGLEGVQDVRFSACCSLVPA